MKKIIIQATLIDQTAHALRLDCEGDLIWFPKSQVTFNAEKEELEAPLWLLKEKFPNEEF